MTEQEPFEMTKTEAPAEAELVVDLEGYEGPIDMLLTLAREQKVDLTKISILQLADQYLDYIAAARQLRLEIAADYLVMAAWLAYLKSRLLLPEPPPSDEPSGAELAAALTHQLQRLEAMQQAGARLMARPLLGRDVFPRGAPEGLPRVLRPIYEVTLYDLLRAYGDQRQRKESSVLHIEAPELFSMDDALQRLSRLLGRVPEWRTLMSFLPTGLRGGLIERSAVAATFAASLELVRSGKLQLRQDTTFGPIYMRSPPETS
ncbi:MAG TPA: ScpA family protein [Stellaceae bacterium]|nr:ScpA family protein [Stellaceae bacterium]